MTDQRIQQEAICYQWFKQRLILSVSKPSISQRSQIKEDTVEPFWRPLRVSPPNCETQYPAETSVPVKILSQIRSVVSEKMRPKQTEMKAKAISDPTPLHVEKC